MNVNKILNPANLSSLDCRLYCPLNGNIYDYSGNTDLTFTDHSVVYGKSSNGQLHANWNGSSWIQITDSSNSLSFTTGSADLPCTMMAWVLSNIPSEGTWALTNNSGVTDGTQFEYIFGISDVNGLTFRCYDDGGGNSIYAIYDWTDYDSEWHHIAARYDGSGSQTGIDLFVDGNIVDSTKAIATYDHMSLEACYPAIGVSNYGGGYEHISVGRTAEVLAFGIELTDKQIQEFMIATYTDWE